ncbi:acyl carrier protein [Mesoterricola silvestris]|uniref:Acyl carrier protein n=1 Tax=Mesoterricola silvestris TaxID=2927979 RepID=A0AA48GQ95_9BACT|nr:acyl carrier protein [Mesoterricola silvestris]BDU74129.1 acyl carrier protein [Mesoterricola silvestris]
MALETTSVAPKIRDYIAENFLFSDQGYGYGDDTSFLEEGIIDSLGIIELVAFVEKAFGISVSDSELLPDNFDSVAKLSAYVAGKMEKAS